VQKAKKDGKIQRRIHATLAPDPPTRVTRGKEDCYSHPPRGVDISTITLLFLLPLLEK